MTSGARIPSYLKGLVETRARSAAQVERYQTVLADVEKRLATAMLQRDAADTLILRFNKDLDPSTIQPLRSWRERYKKHGALREAIRDFLATSYPAAVTTHEVAWHLAIKFELDFETGEIREKWKKSSVRNPLRAMAGRGEVERLEVYGVDGEQVSSWRWISPAEKPADEE